MSRKDPDKLSEQLSAYLDGELTERERQSVERTLERDPSARALLDELRRTAELLHELPRRRAPESLLPELTEVIERRQLLDAADRSAGSVAGPRRWFSVLALAAVIALVATAGLWVWSRAAQRGEPGSGTGPVALRNQAEPALAPGRAPAPSAAKFNEKREHFLEDGAALAFRRPSAGAELQSADEQRLKGPAEPAAVVGRALEAAQAAPLAPDAVDTAAPSTTSAGESSLADTRDKLADSGEAARKLGLADLDQNPIVLNASFNDAKERDASAERINDYFMARGAQFTQQELDDRSAYSEARDKLPADADRLRVMTVHEGEYVVAVPAPQLADCLSVITAAAAPDVELVSGPFVARGSDQVQMLIQFARRQPPPTPARGPMGGGKGGGRGAAPLSAERGQRFDLEPFVLRLRQLMLPKSQPEESAADNQSKKLTESAPATRGAGEAPPQPETPADRRARAPSNVNDGWVTLVVNLLIAPPAMQEPVIETQPTPATQGAPVDTPERSTDMPP